MILSGLLCSAEKKHFDVSEVVSQSYGWMSVRTYSAAR